MIKTTYLETKHGFLSERDKIFPSMVVVKITNMCNLECIHCPYRFVSKQKNYKPKHMKWELYEKIIEEVSHHKGVVFRLLCDGEPLLHPKFLDMLKLAQQKKIGPVNFITNGVLLNEELAKGILESGVDVMEVSLDALTKETYEKIRRGSNYELVMSNLHKFIEMRNKFKAKTKIMVSMIDQAEAEFELDAFRKYWELKVDRVITRVYTTIGGLVDDAKLKIGDKGDRWPCPQLWRRFFINADGFAEFCVEDWQEETIIGDVNNMNIKEIWSSTEYEKIRELHLSKKFCEIPYCSECKDWKAREWKYDYFYALSQVLGKGAIR